MKKNNGGKASNQHTGGGGRTKLRRCAIHQIFYLKKYPHVCDGIPVETPAKRALGTRSRYNG